VEPKLGLAAACGRESQISADQGKKKMPSNAKSTRQTEDFPTGKDFKREGDPDETRIITRGQRPTTKTADL
jgi:hypothetical protein